MRGFFVNILVLKLFKNFIAIKKKNGLN